MIGDGLKHNIEKACNKYVSLFMIYEANLKFYDFTNNLKLIF